MKRFASRMILVAVVLAMLTGFACQIVTMIQGT